MEFNATFIVAFVSFIVFTVIMNLILYKPLSRIVAERQKFIDTHYEEAKLHKKNSEKILRDKAKKLELTKHDAKKIIVNKTNEVKAQKSSMTTDAQQSASKTVDGAKEELYKSRDEAQEVLSNEIINLAQGISSKILGEHIKINKTDKNLISKLIKDNE